MAEKFSDHGKNAGEILFSTGEAHVEVLVLYADAGLKPPLKAPLKKDEPIAPLQKDLELPNGPAEKKVWGLQRSIMENPAGACDSRPQSPWVTGKPVADDCGIKLSTVYPKVRDSVTQAIVPQPDGTTNWGAAFKYCDTNSKKCVYVTNDHVAQDADQVGLVAQDGKTLKYGRVLDRDTVHDLVIVSVPSGDTRPSIKVGTPPKVGDEVFTVGHPYGIPGDVISAGTVTDTNSTVTDINTFQTYTGLIESDVRATPGNSGGPEYNKKGEVIGVKANAGQSGHSMSVPIKLATDMVK